MPDGRCEVLLLKVSQAEAVLRFYREFIADAPEQFGGFPAWQIAPPLPFIPGSEGAGTVTGS